MCTGAEIPLIAAAVGASGVGSYMQQKENNDNVNRQYNARNAVALQGVQQQDADAAKSNAVLQKTIGQFQAPQQAQDLGSLITARTNTINGNTDTPSAFVDPTANANAPKVVQSELAKKMADAAAFTQQQGGALAKIGATGDQSIGNALNLNTSGNQIGMLSNFAKGDYGVNQAQQRSAYENARKSPNPVWGILQQAGNAAGMYAAGGGTIGDIINPGTGAGLTQADTSFLNAAQHSAGVPTIY